MPAKQSRLQRLLAALQAHHGRVTPPSRDPWHLILRENVVYLVGDDARLRAFDELRRHTGLEAAAIQRCPDELLLAICGGGRLAPKQVQKLRQCAQLFADVGDPRALVKLPAPQAKRALRRFPGIGAPGAERLMLLAGREPVLALDSNGLRTLLRLGYGAEAKSYSTSYRSAQTAAAAELPPDVETLAAAHLVLQRHGQTICRNTAPCCERCPARRDCPAAG